MYAKIAALLQILACDGGPEVAPPAPPLPTLAVVVPLSGEAATRGQVAVSAARAAAGERYAVLEVDDRGPELVAGLAARPEVVAVLAHLSAAEVDRSAAAWLATDLPVLTLAAGVEERLPRAAPTEAELGRCAVALIGGRRVALVHDGSAQAMAMVGALQEPLGARVSTLLALDPGDLATDLGRLRAGRFDEIVYVGSPTLGGDLLRALRGSKVSLPFLAVSGSPQEVFATAGSVTGVARVVTGDRAPFFHDALERLTEQTSGPPSGVARNAHDAAAVLVAAIDAVPRLDSGLPERAAVRAAFEQVIGVGVGGPLALVEGKPQPVQCTAYASPEGALTVYGAAQIGADGAPARLALTTERR